MPTLVNSAASDPLRGPILGIESSCDETAAAVLDADGLILAEAVLSQQRDHAPFGGVVPEIAARSHLAHLPALVRDVMARAGVKIGALAAVAATAGPGLIGGLIVGSQFAKGIAIARGLPYIAVNHLEAHALTARLPGLSSGPDPNGNRASGVNTSGQDASGLNARGVDRGGPGSTGLGASGLAPGGPDARGLAPSGLGASGLAHGGPDARGLVGPGPAFPYLLLLVSGGHCQCVAVEGVGRYRRLGTTVDDAAGEAFDKVGKLLGLGWPGGPALERLAASGDASRYAFPRPMLGRPGCDFSFSGLKTAVAQTVARMPSGALPVQEAADLAAGFQAAVADALADRAVHAMQIIQGSASLLVVSGGVAANRAVRTALTRAAAAQGFRLLAPPVRLCTDNAVMVAWAGLERLRLGLVDGIDFAPRPRWPLEDLAR